MVPAVESIVEQFRDLRSDYDAAKKTRFKRRRRGVVSTGSHADYHYRNWTDYAGVMETARDLFRNNPLVGQGIRRLVANVLRGGFTLDIKTGDEGLDSELHGRWKEWSEDPEQCDRQGEQDFHGLERLTLQNVLVDGDVLTLPTEDESLQLIEAHRLRTPTGTRRNVVHGVLMDDFRRRLEYWVTREDISSTASLRKVSDTTQYAARKHDDLTNRDERQVFHHYMPDRITQTRGITPLVPVVDTAGMGDDLLFAQLVKAQMAACVTIFREFDKDVQPPEIPDGSASLEETSEARPNGTTRQIAGFQPGMEMFGYPGEKLQGFSPNVPNAEFFQHANLILGIVAVNLDLPLAVLLLDPSKTNFSGWRGAMDQARQRFQEIQRWFAGSFHSPVYRWKVRQWAAEDNAIRAAVEATVAREGSLNAFNHVWHAQEWPYIEPVNDAMGDVIQERNLLISRRRRAARRGMDLDDLDTEIIEDRISLIRKSDAAAKLLNAELALNLTWQDIVHWPMPEGVSVSVGGPSGNNTADSGQGEGQSKHPRFATLERINGHAN